MTSVKLAIIGSRSFNDYGLVKETIDQLKNFYEIEVIVSGGAKGADSFGERYAKENNIETLIFKPDWSLGRGAGFLRNTDIIKNCDMVLAFWDDKSNGTRDSINKAKKLGKEVKIIYF